ncbi:MAG: VWA domain-containing protein, partial [Methylococcaceae bacterium]|nr:VWA domain-containing protein [Methylococcaceae bacterium]
MKAAKRDFALLLLATLAMLLCLSRPAISLSRNTFRYLFVVDITQSMNTPDYHENDLPPDRLSFSKRSLSEAIRDLPCGSEAGIGLFSTKDVLLLIEPLEICAHFAAIDDAIAHIDWRMAWSADSNVERGLYGGILAAKNLAPGTNLVFMSDGEQNVRELHRPPLAKHAGTIKGHLIGVGGSIPSPIPRLDQDNRLTGFWNNGEVDEFSIGPKGLEPSARKNPDPEGIYQSSLHESNLQMLAAMSGLEYQRLESPKQFSKILQSEDLAKPRTVETDIRWLFAMVSFLLILTACLVPAEAGRRDRSSGQ